MQKHIGKEYTFIDADEGKYLVEAGKESAGKLVRAIYKSGEDVPEFEERNIEE